MSVIMAGSSSTTRIVPSRTVVGIAGVGCSRGGRDVQRGEVGAEGGAFALFGVDGQAATGFGEDSVDGRQSQAGALARGLGREERLEHVCEHIGAHADSGVAYRQLDVAPRAGVGM